MSDSKDPVQGANQVRKTIKLSVAQFLIGLFLVAGLFSGGGFWLAKTRLAQAVAESNQEDKT